MRSNDPDISMRLAAFEHVQSLGDRLTSKELKPGLIFKGERIALHNPGMGIHKPKQMQYLLSIKTVFPSSGRPVLYDDQKMVKSGGRQIFEGDGVVDYAFMGKDPDAAPNRHLREAFENQIPVIYFIGVAPGVYRAIIPTFIAGWDKNALKARVVFGDLRQHELTIPSNVGERSYAYRDAMQRLHQASFREAVITAYKGRCAMSGLSEQRLLDAAHIIDDKDERFGQPVVPNGLLLSKIHHAAFNTHLIGIDPDYRLHVSGQLLYQHDGPMLEALKQLNGERLHLPGRVKNYPDQDRLALRFEHFRAAI